MTGGGESKNIIKKTNHYTGEAQNDKKTIESGTNESAWPHTHAGESRERRVIRRQEDGCHRLREKESFLIYGRVRFRCLCREKKGRNPVTTSQGGERKKRRAVRSTQRVGEEQRNLTNWLQLSNKLRGSRVYGKRKGERSARFGKSKPKRASGARGLQLA